MGYGFRIRVNGDPDPSTCRHRTTRTETRTVPRALPGGRTETRTEVRTWCTDVCREEI